MESEQVEEYLEAIYGIIEEGGRARTTELARRLKVKPASVTGMLGRLSREGYVEYQPYRGVKLTPRGLELGRRMKRKHRLLERFLFDVLKIKKNRVHSEACRMEHALSDDAEKAIDGMLGHPEACPDDNKRIPGRTRLANLKNGQKARVIRLCGGSGLKSRLRSMGLREGVLIEVKAMQPLGGPAILTAGGSTLALGRGMASRILVEAES